MTIFDERDIPRRLGKEEKQVKKEGPKGSFSLGRGVFLQALNIAEHFGGRGDLYGLYGFEPSGKWAEIAFTGERPIIWVTDGETDISFPLSETVNLRGSFAFEAGLLKKVVASLSQGRLDCQYSVGLDRAFFQLRDGRTTSTFKVHQTGEPPRLISPEEDSFTSFLSAADFLKASRQVVFATHKNQELLVSGVLVRIQDKKMALLASDGYRAAKKTIDITRTDQASGAVEMIISQEGLYKILWFLDKINKPKSENLQVSIDPKSRKAVFTFGDFRILSRNIGEGFPDVLKRVPQRQTWTTAVTVGTQALLQAIRRGIPKQLTRLDFQISESKLMVVTSNPELGDYRTSLEARVEGEGGVVSFNPVFITEFLKKVDSQELIIGIIRPEDPVVFNPKDDESYMYAVMPSAFSPS